MKSLILIAASMLCLQAGGTTARSNATPLSRASRPSHVMAVRAAATAPMPTQARAEYEFSKDMITTTPAGVETSGMSRSMRYCTFDGETLQFGQSNYSVANIVKGNDGNYYFSDPISQLYASTWLRLSPAKGDTLVARLPQPVFSQQDDNGNDEYFYAFPMKLYLEDDGFGGTTPFLKLDTLDGGTRLRDSLRFVLRNDSLIQLDDVYMGLVNDKLQWAGYGDGEIVINKITVPKYEPTAEQIKRAQLYIMRTGDADSTRDWQVVKTVKDGNDIYVCNPYNNSDSQWMKGSLQGNMLHFDGNQYLGIDSTYMIHLYSRAAHYTLHEESDPVWGTNTSYYTFSFAPALDMPYNTAAGGYGVGDAAADTLAWLINAGNTVPFFVSSYIRPLFSPYADEASGPQAPQFQANQCKPYTTEEGYGYITFSYSKFDKKGHFLNPSKYFYRVFTLLTDDPMEPPHEFVFKADTYGSLKNDATQIPVQYADRSDFFTMNGSKDGEPTKAWASFNTYTNDFKAIGVQLVYGNSVTDIRWWRFLPTSVSTVSKDTKVVSTAYYDLTGRPLNAPSSGVCIKVTYYNDGSHVTQKMIGTAQH